MSLPQNVNPRLSHVLLHNKNLGLERKVDADIKLFAYRRIYL